MSSRLSLTQTKQFELNNTFQLNLKLTWSVFDFDTIYDNIWGPVEEDRAGERVPDNSLVYAGSSLDIKQLFFIKNLQRIV